MAFSTSKEKLKRVALDYDTLANEISKINPTQGPVLTKLFQLQGTGSANPAASTIAMNVIAWPLTTPVVIERVGLSASQQNIGVTVGQRVACALNITATAGAIHTLPPQFPAPVALPGGWAFNGSLWQIEFSSMEGLRDYTGAQVVFMPDIYQLEVYALGTFAMSDSCEFTLTIHYKLQM